ncbi:hypothetical protein CRUP_036722 [Coryphaenoides rupestris]|nr:hypothetical protein CRUP_036722 [Coryphaenoides rupestris]
MAAEEEEQVMYFVGVDVGHRQRPGGPGRLSGSAAEEPIGIWEPQVDHYVQSSAEIWHKQAAGPGASGSTPTCSLVVLDRNFQPVAVNQDGRDRRHNVVMWMDPPGRAPGGPHYRHRPPGPGRSGRGHNLRDSCWAEAAHFLDLPDFLSWKATGSLTRSLCTLVCKWSYCPPEGWDDSFWTDIGLEDLLEDNYRKIADLGLDPGTAVGTSLIDAHAGGLGVIGADVKGLGLPCEDRPITSRMAVICGTSSCHMAVSQGPVFVPGVWGPYLSAMVPDLWLNEGGQSATGRLHVYTYLNAHLGSMAKTRSSPSFLLPPSSSSSPVDLLGSALHVWPDFHGNRSPLADPTLRGMVTGLSLSQTVEDLALQYLATMQALALGTRHILDTMTQAGHDITTLFLCGGLSKNPLFVQIHANATGLPLVLPGQTEAVLVGAAILGACASQEYQTIQEAMENMAKVGEVVWPAQELASFYERKYRVFLRLSDHQREYQALMKS